MKTVIVSLFLLCFFSQNLYAQWWKTYPYSEQGTVLTFPADEGHHPGHPVEWWYTTGHVTGASSGTDYSFMLTYFYYPTFGLDGFRIFNIANDDTGEFYDETMPVMDYSTLSQTHLDIKADLLGGPQEVWTTLRDSANNLIPFEYSINAVQANGAINLTYRAVKRPLILGDTGFFYQGSTGHTFYYSQTMIEITGTITYKGVTETVTGIGWIDRQWGQFTPNNGEEYEWFSVQLDNDMDINIWNIFNEENQVPDTSTYRLASIYVNDTTDMDVHDFEMTRLQFNCMPDSVMCYARQWRFVYQDIDLLITTLHTNSEVALPFRFFEGATTVTGTVGGVAVTGKGFAETLHSYAKPQVVITSPLDNATWNGFEPFTWQLVNPDDGRPVYYDVEISYDNKASFIKIAQNITDTFLVWSPTMTSGSEAWLRVIGYSVDSALVGGYTMNNSFTYLPTGISTIGSGDLSFTIYPNPTSGKFTLALPASAKGMLEIKIYNSLGAEVLGRAVESNSSEKLIEFDVSKFSSGVYYVGLKSGDAITYGRFMISR